MPAKDSIAYQKAPTQKDFRVIRNMEKGNPKLFDKIPDWIIISSHSQDELVRKYGPELDQYKPYIIRSPKEQFNLDCLVIDLCSEYDEWSGTELWAICTDYSEKELIDLYYEEIKQYLPFLLLSKAQGDVIQISKQNDKKFLRRKRRECQLDIEDLDNLIYDLHLCAYKPVEDDFEVRNEISKIFNLIKGLNLKRQRRITRFLIFGESFEEISKKEGISLQGVSQSIHRILNLFQKKCDLDSLIPNIWKKRK